MLPVNTRYYVSNCYAPALLVGRKKLTAAQDNNDVVTAQEILKHAFRTDVRALVAEARLIAGGSLQPLEFYRSKKIRQQLIAKRGTKTITTGL